MSMFFPRLLLLLPWRRRALERDMQEELRSIADMAGPGELGNLTLVATFAAIFGLVALLLIAVGLYGLLAFTVSRRTPEIGIRVALGATRASVRWLVGRQALRIVGAGLALGIPAAWIAGRLASRQLASLLYNVTSTDLAPLAVATGVLVGVAACASLLPARRAVRIDPVVALRNE